MQTSVLLSIKPKFANAILDGTKTFELRRVIFRPTVRKIIIYASNPVMLVIGEFIVGGILEREPNELWAITSNCVGVDRESFDEYFRGRKTGFAIKVDHPRRYAKPLKLENFGLSRAPQSFCYLAQSGED